MFENIVIGTPLVEPAEMFALNEDDWERIEKPKTLFTEERYLPRLIVQAGVMKSVSEVKRNRKDLDLILNELDFMKIKIGKRFLFVLVGQ